ncbi:hypothetical protein FRB90_004149 [Tulasnella sp. 427]|nr:hypothetical protein FRB90_004149 [Tulasnella sp. 427]
MVFSCTNPVHQLPRPSVTEVPENQPKTLRGRMRQASMFVRIDKSSQKDEHALARMLNRLSNAVAGLVVLMFIVISERQIKVNNVLPGENILWSFSQLAALMLAVAPVWPIAISYLSNAHEKKERKKSKSIDCVNSPPPIGAVNGHYGGGGFPAHNPPLTPIGGPTSPFPDEPMSIPTATTATAVANGYFPSTPAPAMKKRGASVSVSFAEPPNFRAPPPPLAPPPSQINSSSTLNVLGGINDEPESQETAVSSSMAVPASTSVPTRRPPPRRQRAIPASESLVVGDEPVDSNDPFGLAVFGRRSPGDKRTGNLRMKLSALLVAATLGVASAAPISLIYITNNGRTIIHTSSQPSAETNFNPFANIRFGHAAAFAQPGTTPTSAVQRTHAGCGGLRAKMNRLREMVGLAPVMKEDEDGFFHIMPVPHHPVANDGGVEGRVTMMRWHAGASEAPSSDSIGILPFPHPRYRIREQSFWDRLHRALNQLGPWEGRAVTFVLGCGLGVLLRMFVVFGILMVRARRARQAIQLPVESQVIFVAPPQYIAEEGAVPVTDEKVPVYEVVVPTMLVDLDAKKDGEVSA